MQRQGDSHILQGEVEEGQLPSNKTSEHPSVSVLPAALALHNAAAYGSYLEFDAARSASSASCLSQLDCFTLQMQNLE